jgi:hypothetical protein
MKADTDNSAQQLQVTNPKGVTVVGPFTSLESVLLRINGGGMTTNQTANAMADGEQVRDGKTVKRNGYQLKRVGGAQ